MKIYLNIFILFLLASLAFAAPYYNPEIKNSCVPSTRVYVGGSLPLYDLSGNMYKIYVDQLAIGGGGTLGPYNYGFGGTDYGGQGNIFSYGFADYLAFNNKGVSFLSMTSEPYSYIVFDKIDPSLSYVDFEYFYAKTNSNSGPIPFNNIWFLSTGDIQDIGNGYTMQLVGYTGTDAKISILDSNGQIVYQTTMQNLGAMNPTMSQYSEIRPILGGYEYSIILTTLPSYVPYEVGSYAFYRKCTTKFR